MLITHDMLVTKGVDSYLIYQFDNECPSGFDFSSTMKESPSSIPLYTLAELFNYTGLHTRVTRREIIQTNFVNGLVENFPNGNPGAIWFSKFHNIPWLLRFYAHGKLQNPHKYSPAEITFCSNKEIESRYFYENGELNDPAEGIPAFVYNCFSNKTIRYYKNGKLNDPKSGIAADRSFFPSGNIQECHYRDGIKI